MDSVTRGSSVAFSKGITAIDGRAASAKADASGPAAAGTGAAAVNALGYTIFGNPLDSVYHMEFTFAHAGGTLSLNWSSTLNQFADDESWGLDNIVVQSVPAPGTLAGLAGAMLLTGRRRRK